MTMGEIVATIGVAVAEATTAVPAPRTAGQGRPIVGLVTEVTTVVPAQPTAGQAMVVITVAVAGGTTFAMSMTIDGKTGAKIGNRVELQRWTAQTDQTDQTDWTDRIDQTDQTDQIDQIDQTGQDPTSSREK